MIKLELKKIFKKLKKNDKGIDSKSKETAKERLHLVLMQDRANVSADFLDMMKQEIIEVIKKYIDIDEKAIDVKLTNKMNDDGTVGAPALYANIPIVTIKNEARKVDKEDEEKNVDVELEENKTEENNVKENVDTEEAEEIKIEEPDRDKNNDANNKDNENNTKENPEEKNINNNQNASEKNENEDKNKVDEEEAKKEKANK